MPKLICAQIILILNHGCKKSKKSNRFIPVSTTHFGCDLAPEIIKILSCKLSMVLLINLKLLTIANSFLQNIAEHENFSANKYEYATFISRENFMLS